MSDEKPTCCFRLPYCPGKNSKVKEFDYSGPLEYSGQLLRPIRRFEHSELKRATKRFNKRFILDDENPNVTVYRGVLATREVVKVRRTITKSTEAALHEQFYAELKILSRVHHRNLISLVGFCVEGQEQLLVYELLSNGTLSDHLYGNTKSPLSLERRLEIALGVAKGIAHLHEDDPPIVHRNINSSSILLGKKYVPKISEFGNSKQVTDETECSRATTGYQPPEFYATRRSTEKSDVFSFGVVLLELLTGQKSYDPERRGNEEMLLVNMMKKASREGWAAGILPRLDPYIRFTTQYSQDNILENVSRLALRCVDDESRTRPTMKSVIENLETVVHTRSTHPKTDLFKLHSD